MVPKTPLSRALQEKKIPSRALVGLATLLYIVIIFLLSSIPGDRLYIPSGMDYIAHIIEYALLSFLVSYLVFLRYEGFYPYPVISFSVAVGIVNEIYQIAIPMRTPSVVDVMADLIGAFLGVWIFAVVFEREWIDGIRNKIL